MTLADELRLLARNLAQQPSRKLIFQAADRLDVLEQVADENYADLLDQMQERWGDAREVGRPEINAFLESRFVHKPTTRLRAERDAARGEANLALASMRQAEKGEAEADRQLAEARAALRGMVEVFERYKLGTSEECRAAKRALGLEGQS